MVKFSIIVPLCIISGIFFSFDSPPKPSQSEMSVIGRQIWKNECGGKVEGLTSLNQGEDFASLGIGHFIWYHAKNKGPFEEIFPQFITYVQKKQLSVPAWMTGPCPWNSRDEFVSQINSEQMKQLRTFLVDSIPLQTLFMEDRLVQALPKITANLTSDQKDRVIRQFQRLVETPGGFYPLVDYVNFKGEGIKPTERYNGHNWGLLQVLQEMELGSNALEDFSIASAKVLKRRVQNAPPERNEQRWLPGWLNRCATYAHQLK